MPIQGRILRGDFGGLGPPGHQRGAKKKKKKGRERKREGRKEEKGGKEGKKEGARKKKERKLNQYDERGTMQFQVQAGAPGKKTSGRQIEKRTRGASCRVYAVSSASRGSREENVRGAKLRKGRGGRHAESMQFQEQAGAPLREEHVMGAKLTEKRTRDAPCSFKCKQGLQGRKCQGRQIDGEKDERGAM